MWVEKCMRSVCQTVRSSYSLGIVITITASTRQQCVRSHPAALSRYSTIKSLHSCSLSLSTTGLKQSTNSLKCVRFGEYLQYIYHNIFCLFPWVALKLGLYLLLKLENYKDKRIKNHPFHFSVCLLLFFLYIILYVIVDPKLFTMLL